MRSRCWRSAPGQETIVQKSAFLADEAGVNLSIHFQKRLGAGFFGGEGFIMQRLSSRGMAFVDIDGDLMKYNLKPGHSIIIDTGNVAGFEPSVQMDIQQVQGAKNIFIGGEGLFNTVLTGSGRVWLQTRPIYDVANASVPTSPPAETTDAMDKRDEETGFSIWVNWERRVISFTQEKGFEELQYPTHDEVFRFVVEKGNQGFGIQ